MSELKIEPNEALTRFLVFSYFGIDIEDKDYQKGDIIGACVRRAYLDMCRTLRFSSEGKDGGFYNAVAGQLISAFADEKQSLESKRKNAYDVFFPEQGSPTKEYFSSQFSCGQAQKWINMTFKYMWLLGLIGPEGLEAPVDRLILEALTKKDAWEQKTVWSAMDPNTYGDVKQAIADVAKDKTVIEWENNVWIEQAKEEAKQKKSKEQKNEQRN